MSSILEALKKLETSKDEPAEEFTWPQSVNAKEALNSRLKGGGFFKHPALIFFSVAFTVVCLFILVENKKRGILPDEPGLPVEKPGETAEKERPVQIKPVEIEKTPEQQIIVESDVSDDPIQVVVENRLEQKKTELSALSKTLSDTEIRSFEAENSAIESIETVDEETETYYSEAYNLIPKEMLPPKKMVDENWLKLHAISWSEDPGRRIAVINSVIVKEGRVVDGGLVSRIDRDYVVIVKGGEEFMLPFGLR